MTGFIQSVASHPLKNHFILDAHSFFKCLMFACCSLSLLSNFTARSVPQKNQIGSPYRTVLAIKMRGPDLMRAGSSGGLCRETAQEDRSSLLRELYVFFFSIVQFVLYQILDWEHLIANSGGIKWASCILTWMLMKKYWTGQKSWSFKFNRYLVPWLWCSLY